MTAVTSQSREHPGPGRPESGAFTHCWIRASRSPPSSLSLRRWGTELPGQDSFSGSSLLTAGCSTLRLRLQPSPLFPHSPGEAGSPEAEEPAWGLGPGSTCQDTWTLPTSSLPDPDHQRTQELTKQSVPAAVEKWSGRTCVPRPQRSPALGWGPPRALLESGHNSYFCPGPQVACGGHRGGL